MRCHLALTVLVLLGQTPAFAQVIAQPKPPTNEQSTTEPEWLRKLDRAFATSDIIEAVVEYRPDTASRERQARVQSERALTSEDIRQGIGAVQQDLLTYLRSQNIEIIKAFEYQPLIRIRVSVTQAQSLAERSDVVSLHVEDLQQREQASPRESLKTEQSVRQNDIVGDSTRQVNAEYVNADKVWAKGFQGQGFAVAILDDGINAQHEMFRNKIVAEACFSNASGKGNNLCPGGATTAVGTGAASQCSSLNDICGHGSHVAGIAVGNNRGTIFVNKGVAPEASVVAVQVFSRRTGTDNCKGGETSCVVASNFDIAAALDWVIANAARYNIAAVNMSLGSGTYSSYCDSETILTAGINALRKMSVLTTISAGNDGDLRVVSHPSCVRNAVTVSSVIITVPDPGVNHAPLVDLLAPGYLSFSALGTGSTSYGAKTGTSMAAPHVAGAIALLKSARPQSTADEIEYAMVATGPLTDYIGWTWKTPRLDVNAALNILGATPPPPGIALAGIFSGASPVNSFIRLMNTGTSSGSARVTLVRDTPKTVLGSYDVAVPPNASVQVAVADIEKAINFPGTTVSVLSAYIDSNFRGYIQNVVFNQAGGAFTNLTACSSSLVDPRNFLGNAHTPKLSGYPSDIFVHNTGTNAAKAGFDIFDSRSGVKRGSIETGLVEPNTSASFSVISALNAIGFTEAMDNYHVNFKLQSSFRGFAGHVVENASSGVFTDMSAKCPI